MLAEKILEEKIQSPEPLNVLLIGNNPIEMGNVMDKIKQMRGRIVNTEIAFDTKYNIVHTYMLQVSYI